jgi:heme-degrading monooxygenase HmoA
MTHHLAQVNIARLVAPIDDPHIADFVAQLDGINALAERSPGFVWRLKTAAGNATDVVFNDDPFVIVNMSVWESVESLRAYTYASNHVEVFRRRAEWFEKPAKPHYCLWWVPEGHAPAVAEARERLEHYQTHGATPYSFWFSQLYPPD